MCLQFSVVMQCGIQFSKCLNLEFWVVKTHVLMLFLLVNIIQYFSWGKIHVIWMHTSSFERRKCVVIAWGMFCINEPLCLNEPLMTVPLVLACALPWGTSWHVFHAVYSWSNFSCALRWRFVAAPKSFSDSLMNVSQTMGILKNGLVVL
jgi:hypothetical protein